MKVICMKKSAVAFKPGFESLKMPCLIPARGGSKTIPRKNLRELDGKPLILHTIDFAIKSGLFSGVYVSSDDAEILELAKKAGARAIERPAEFAKDTSLMKEVVEHWLGLLRQDGKYPLAFALLMPTTPFRRREDVAKAIGILRTDPRCDSVFGVFEAKDPPFWTLVDDGTGLLRALYPDKYYARHQDLPKAYFGGPFYLIETAAYEQLKRFITDKTRYVVVGGEFSIEIDDEMDFKWAEFWARERRKK